MLILVILCLFLFLLISILICRDNKYCTQMLFIGYLILISIFLGLAYMYPPTRLMDSTLHTIRIVISPNGSISTLEEEESIEAQDRDAERLDKIEIDEMFDPDAKSITSKV